TVFYWREWYEFADDGTLHLKITGYDPDGSHWTGYADIPVRDNDYKLWCWIIMRGRWYGNLINDNSLNEIREDFRAWQSSWLAWWYRRLTSIWPPKSSRRT